ncbi:MAG: acid phosphatase [Chthoniobacteraceae bacterium]
MKENHRLRLAGIPILVAGLASLLSASLTASANLSFSGVAAGDTSDTEAILWTRAVDSAAPANAALTLQLSPDSTFTTGIITANGTTDSTKDYTLKLDVTGLTPGTRYYYRFVGPNGELSNIGTFKTAPSANTSATLHFAFSGDCDGLMRPYALASQLPAKALDFFVFDGDTIYETASNGSAAATSTGNLPAPSSTGATAAQLFTDYSRRYREQFIAVNSGGQNCLQSFFAGQGNYTLLDNHELGNKQYINGGAPQGGAVGDFTIGAGVDARVSSNDANTSGAFMNQTGGYQTLQQVWANYQPVKETRGTGSGGVISAPSDARTNGTKQYYYAQQWGKNSIFITVDDRQYRDIRMKTSANADDTGSRADSTSRTMIGATQLAWLESTLLNAQNIGTKWKFVVISDPIDQIGPIGGALAGVTATSMQPYSGSSAYSPVASDGGKSWIGGYRAERNALLKFIADNKIRNVVFLATDDHQNRVNELLYSPTGQTGVQSSYTKVPYCFEVVCGPLGATGPDLFLNHDFASIKGASDLIANAQISASLEPIGLAGYPGLHNVTRLGDANADTLRQPADFYSPDTFNYNTFDVTADGKTLTITSYGIKSTAQNSFAEYDSVNNPEQSIFSFQIDAADDALSNIDHVVVIYQENWSFDALYGSFPGANGLSGASSATLNQLDRVSGSPLSSLTGNFNIASRTTPTLNAPWPQPIDTNNGNIVDSRFPTTLNTLLPYDISAYLQPSDKTGDIVHRYWQEQLQVNDGTNDKFITWSDNPGLVMSHFDATNLPEGLLAQQYTICDDFFHSAFGGSFLNHQFLIAAAAPVYPNAATLLSSGVATLDSTGALSLDGTTGKIVHDGNITPIGGQVFAIAGATFDKNYAVNTIFSQNLANSGSPTAASFLPSQNDSNPSDATRPYIPTIGDRLDAANVSWKWYSGGWDAAVGSSPSNPTHYGTVTAGVSSLFQWHHQAFAFYDNYAPFVPVATYNANPSAYPGGLNPYSAARLQDETQFFNDVQNNTLPSVCFIKPLGPDNEHPGYASLLQGQNHVASLIAAIQANPTLWAHTAVIITYDEHGGRWDHVTPPVRDIWGPGVRVPCIVVSPFAKRGFVDHSQYDTTSILSTIEHRFGLASLNTRDAAAPTLANSFTTEQLSRGSFSYNRRTAKMTQTVTFTNAGSSTLAGPVYLALDSLSSNATLVGATGTAANGSPYIAITTGALAPGASASLTLQFNDPSLGGITYSPRTVSGGPTP